MAPATTHASAIPPGLRLRRWHTWLVVWRVHRWLGFGFGALLVLLSVSGSLLVLHHELEHWLEPELHVTAPATAVVRPALSDLARMVTSNAPQGYRPFRILPARRADATHKFLFRASDSTARWAIFVEPSRKTHG